MLKTITLTERLFLIKRIPIFATLRDNELATVAGVVTQKTYMSNQPLLYAGQLANCLHLIVNGQVMRSDDTLVTSPVIGAASLLFNIPPTDTLRAGFNEMQCLLIAKHHFFTIVNECPNIIVGLIENPSEF